MQLLRSYRDTTSPSWTTFWVSTEGEMKPQELLREIKRILPAVILKDSGIKDGFAWFAVDGVTNARKMLQKDLPQLAALL